MSVKFKGSGRLYNILWLPVPRAGKVIRYAGSLMLGGSWVFQKRDQEVNSVQAAAVTDVALPPEATQLWWDPQQCDDDEDRHQQTGVNKLND